MECLLCKGKSQNIIPLCMPCQKDLPWHHSETIGFYYKPPIDQWISLLKFHQKLQYAHLLGHLLIYKFKKLSPTPKLILPMPLHYRRLLKRGFNQAIEISKPIAHHFKIPIERHLLKRIKHTKPQSELSFTDRQSNLINAFQCKKPIPDIDFVLFDDVMTTGNTINAACQALSQAGAQHIQHWCCAKTKR